ncbi:MAG: GNAT family N-acetyltransferase [Bacteroidetes bacterium]|nr:GNAT family N-acetyltransferase [Bacteroidota bacterium]
MKFQQTEVLLKNNDIITIQICDIEDAEELLRTVKTYLADSEYIPVRPEEFTISIEKEKLRIRSFLENDNSLLLIAKKGNEILGNIDITGSQKEAIKHTAVIGMGMLKEYRNKGLGTALLRKGIEWARQNPVLEILWLQVYAENTAGVTLYRNAGFEINGIQKKFFKSKENIYFDNVIMSLDVR